jgi:hypothetical protein
MTEKLSYRREDVMVVLGAYLEAMRWTEEETFVRPGRKGRGLTAAAMTESLHDCRQFLHEKVDVLWRCCLSNGWSWHETLERAGHDLWLTRNRHGAGFWDGDWPTEYADELTAAAHDFGCLACVPVRRGLVELLAG